MDQDNQGCGVQEYISNAKMEVQCHLALLWFFSIMTAGNGSRMVTFMSVAKEGENT